RGSRRGGPRRRARRSAFGETAAVGRSSCAVAGREKTVPRFEDRHASGSNLRDLRIILFLLFPPCGGGLGWGEMNTQLPVPPPPPPPSPTRGEEEYYSASVITPLTMQAIPATLTAISTAPRIKAPTAWRIPRSSGRRRTRR